LKIEIQIKGYQLSTIKINHNLLSFDWEIYDSNYGKINISLSLIDTLLNNEMHFKDNNNSGSNFILY